MFVKMFIINFFCMCAVNIVAQHHLFDSYKSNPNYEVKFLEDSTVEVFDKLSNHSWRKSFKQYPEKESTTEANLIISLDTVNFALYDTYYKYWGQIPAVNSYGKFIAVDANKNGKNELYVYSRKYYGNQDFYQAEIFEQTTDSLFTKIYEYQDSSELFYDIGDITGDGLLDLISGGVNFYKQSSSNSLINEPNFIYNPFPSVYQFNDVTFYDIDGDGNQEIIYFLDAGSLDSIWAGSNHIAKYNPDINNYELIYYHRPQPEWFTSGISTGDFDQDGKGNFATGSIGGKFFIYEYVEGNQY